MFFQKLLLKILWLTRNFDRGPPLTSGFCALFSKKRFFKFPDDFCCKLPRKPKICSFLMKNLQNAFSNIGHKMSMGRVPTKIFGVSEFFYRKFVKNNLRYRRFWAFFQNSILEIFTNWEKHVFFEASNFFPTHTY